METTLAQLLLMTEEELDRVGTETLFRLRDKVQGLFDRSSLASPDHLHSGEVSMWLAVGMFLHELTDSSDPRFWERVRSEPWAGHTAEQTRLGRESAERAGRWVMEGYAHFGPDE